MKLLHTRSPPVDVSSLLFFFFFLFIYLSIFLFLKLKSFPLGIATMKENKGKEVVDEAVKQGVQSQPRPPTSENEKIYRQGLTWVISQVGVVGRKNISQPSLKTLNLLLPSLIKGLQYRSSILIQSPRILHLRRSRSSSMHPHHLALPKKFLSTSWKIRTWLRRDLRWR